ncbi:MAG: (d)CMP kinase [Clostridiales bacterium]|nr:(d)CMP kinase [Clostridiales bacterium]
MINVAIDGPGGAGKSTIAKQLAKDFGFIYVDTGALYRTVGLAAVKRGFKPSDAEKVVPMLPNVKVELKFVNGEQRVFLDGEDVSTDIRMPEISMAASDVSAIPKVREYLFDLQRDIAKKNDCLMDGRDIGTVVLPDAQVKVFLTASAEIRAKRRYDELQQKGVEAKFEDVLAELKQRDYQDSHREIAPLKQADDAILFDSSNLSLQEAIDGIAKIIKEKTEK